MVDNDDLLAGDSESENVSVQRVTARRAARNRLVDELWSTSEDGALHCPVCDHCLSTNDELLLRNSDHFDCHNCNHDLASLAYRREAYDEQRWRSVLSALADLQGSDQCHDCCYAGAIAKACESALANMPRSLPDEHRLVAAALAVADRRQPDCHWSSDCGAVEQYRAQAAQVMALL